ncbi:MAG TPA: hypothetical protein PLP98_00610, partial [Plasticicumulans sp.]|nr:hypothetical protein [Plasticicumulans sp.]
VIDDGRILDVTIGRTDGIRPCRNPEPPIGATQRRTGPCRAVGRKRIRNSGPGRYGQQHRSHTRKQRGSSDIHGSPPIGITVQETISILHTNPGSAKIEPFINQQINQILAL